MNATGGGSGGPALSVILITPGGYAEIETTVRHLRAQTIAGRVELVIVAERRDRVAVPAGHAAELHGVRIVEVPDLSSLATGRAAGVSGATAPIVAFSEDHSFPEPGWAEALLRAYERGYAGVAPQMKNGNPASALSWAAMFLHFGNAVEPAAGFEAAHPAASHNMSYRRDVLLELSDRLEELVLAEMFLQDALRARGHRLWLEPGAATRHVNMSRLLPALAHAWVGGRLYGGLRARLGAWSAAWRIVYASGVPLIPLVRLRRTIGEMRRTRSGRRALPTALPIMAAMLVMHSAGEAAGYLFGVGSTRTAYTAYEVRRRHLVRRSEQALWA